jgi:F-type H+-transporting ATPase subunit a
VARGAAAAAALLAPSLALASGSGVSPQALVVAEPLGFPVTNSMFTSVVIVLALIVGLRVFVGTPKLVPGKGQAVFESILEMLRDLFEPIVGRKAMAWAFPLLTTFFLFILFHNWSGLLPFIGTIGWGSEHDGKFIVETPLLRPHTADLNGTLALALISFGAWFVIVLRFAGLKVLLFDLFGNKADRKELNLGVYAFLSLVFFIVGVIEVVSILIRPVTLSVRLFGNVFGGENLLHETNFIPVFYFLEIIVGFVQAFVFTLLSAVYIGLICNHGDDHHEEHTEGHGAEEARAHGH